MAGPLQPFLSRHASVICVTVTKAQGSTPREEGAEMFVAQGRVWGTIGGGQLEYMAIDEARNLLRSGASARDMQVPLGPEIGQCCGGRVTLRLHPMTPVDRADALDRETARTKARPHVYILGAGHVGRALADLLQHMPVRTVLVDSRAEELALSQAAVDRCHSALPEHEIDTAPPGSAFVVLTHDHGLDFLLTAAALDRGDAAYVGMIGSATKRAKFERWRKEQGDSPDTERLVCPIGDCGQGDKRPNIIAAMVLAEVVAAVSSPDTKAGLQDETPPKGQSIGSVL